MTAADLLTGFRIAALVAVALLLVYAIVRYRSHVLHRPAFAFVVATAVVLAGSMLLGLGDASSAVVEGLQFVAAGCHFAATWLFAAEFLDFGPAADESPAPPDLGLSAEGGGFDDAERE